MMAFDHNGGCVAFGLRAAAAAGPSAHDLEREKIMTAMATETSAKQKQAKEGREANGRFAPGNPGGPGNPYARKVAELRKEMVNFVSADDLKHIVFAIKMKAERGDISAARLLFQYVLGKPLPATDPDRLDVDEWQKLQEQARPPREMSEVMNGVPAQVASDVTRIAWPCKVEKNFAEPLRAGIKVLDELDAQQAKDKRPSGNGGNGQVHVPEPTPNGTNGTLPDWWDQVMREVVAESQREERERRRRAKKRRKHAARR